jgi:hypothetical protein
MADPEMLELNEDTTPERRAALEAQAVEARTAGHPAEAIAWAAKLDARTLTLSALCALKAATPKLLFIVAGGPGSKAPELPRVEVVAKRVNDVLYARWSRAAGDEDTRPTAGRNLLLNIAIHPKRPDLQALLDEYPALADSLAYPALQAAGLVKAEQKKG